jgi:hypothetical protein
LFAPLIIVDASIDIAGYSVVSLARVLLLEGGPEVHQLLAVLVDLSLEFAKLLELGPPRPLGADTTARPRGGPVGNTC